jgi:NCS1 family nucleobase:cation symporter-1
MSKYFRWAELAPREDIHVWEGTTKWGNHDVYGFTSASAYVSAGLSCWETVGAILLGASIAAGNSYLGARPGVDKSLGFTMMTRVTFGLWGSFLPLFTSLLANLVFVSALILCLKKL